MPENTTIYDSIFGSSPAVQASAAARDSSFQDWLNQRKQAVEQQRTEDRRIATFNALGNALTTMVQPIGWAIGGKGTGVTGGVQPVDNRQYLQAFERAMKANDDLRNIGTLEGEYQFNLADEAYKRAQAMEDYGIKQNLELERQAAYAKQRHDYTMAEIEARGEKQLDVAKYKAARSITGRNGIPIEDKMLQTAWTQYVKQRGEHSRDIGRGVERKEGPTFPSFEKWLGDEYGWIVKPKNSGTPDSGSGSSVSSTAPTSGKKANPMGGATPSSASGKKKNPMS